jgi:ATP-binding cassette subfamily B multidrug efflux pump
MRHIRKLLPYFRPYRIQLIGGLALVVLSSGITSIIPWYLRQAIDGIRSNAPISRIWLFAGAIVLTALVGGAMRYGMRELLNGLSRWIEYDLRNDLFKHLTRLDATYFAKMRTGDIMARLTNDLSAVRMAAGPAIMYLTNTIFGGLFALGFMVNISWMLTLLALLPMLLIPIIAVRLGKSIHTRFEAVQEHFSTLTTHAQENLSGVRVVRAYRQERAEIERFNTLNEEYLHRNLSLVRLWGVLHPAFSFLVGIAAVVVLGWGGAMVLNGRISVGSLVAFSMYLAMLTWPLIALGWVINLFQRGDASMGRLVEILDAKPALVTHEPIMHLPPATQGRSIEFRNVGFHFPIEAEQEPRWVLRNVSFVIPKGATFGIVGATGSGKSVLIDLIARLYDPQEGEILIDGVPIQHVPLDELRREIGYVPQESLLFSDTIAANLRYGIEQDQINDRANGDSANRLGTDTQAGDDRLSHEQGERRWREAARIAQLDATVAEFPGGYETMLGERGINLSGGQKQRASIARALARRPSIVLLDDALSAVDTHTEAEILHGLRTALVGRTAVIASHRASALRDATEIIVLDEGRIVERGRNEDLLAQEGRYWTLVRRQRIEEEVESRV